jgi:hypothetical protein
MPPATPREISGELGITITLFAVTTHYSTTTYKIPKRLSFFF